MSARLIFENSINGCKDVSICIRKLNSEDGIVYTFCILQFSYFTEYTLMQSKHKQAKCEHSR